MKMNLTQLKVYIKGFADGLRDGQPPKNEQWVELLKVVEEAQDDLSPIDLATPGGCKCGPNCPCKPVYPLTIGPNTVPDWRTEPWGDPNYQYPTEIPCDVEPNYNEATPYKTIGDWDQN